MTAQKAIKFFDEEITRLNNAPNLNGCEMTDEWREQLEICKLAKAALEKQIPKKPLNRFDEYNGEYGYCPCCNHILTDFKNFHRCTKCGQALDWSDTE